MVQNNLERIIIPMIIKITGKKMSIRMPGIIRKCGMKIMSSNTNSKAPKNRRPAINEIPTRMISIGTIAPNDQ
jgi:hypothetical protein